LSEELLGTDDIALRPCRVELSAGCAFIKFEEDAPLLRESMRHPAGHFELLSEGMAGMVFAKELDQGPACRPGIIPGLP